MTTRDFKAKQGLATGNLAVTGKLSTNLIPTGNGVLNLGNNVARYKSLFLTDVVDINGQQIAANSTHLNMSGNVNIGTLSVTNQLTLNSTVDSTTTGTGSMITMGGVGIKKDLYVGGAIHLANNNGGIASKAYVAYNDMVSGIEFNFNI
jgi:hypothetical protein